MCCGWLVMSLLILGGAILGLGLPTEDAVHALTTGAVGVMTRARLGHTGRPRHAGPMTVSIYTLATLGALLRVFGPTTDLPTTLVLGLAAVGWSGAYVLFGPGLWSIPSSPQPRRVRKRPADESAGCATPDSFVHFYWRSGDECS
ncbi:MAG: NnrS family protein [Acidobacteriota bacterium]